MASKLAWANGRVITSPSIKWIRGSPPPFAAARQGVVVGVDCYYLIAALRKFSRE
jgi:hypothetical protein